MDSDAPEVEEVAVVWGETTLLESESEIEQMEDAHDSRERLVAAEPVSRVGRPPRSRRRI